MGEMRHDWTVAVWEDEGKRSDSEDKSWGQRTSSRTSRKVGWGYEQKRGSKALLGLLSYRDNETIS